MLRPQNEILVHLLYYLMFSLFQGPCSQCGAASVLVEIGVLTMKVSVKKVHHAVYDMGFTWTKY